MSPAWNQPCCGVCGHKLVKNGKTSAGRTRWRCRACGASTTQRRPDIQRRAEIESFASWLLSKHSQAESHPHPRSARRHRQWCWQVRVPQPRATGQIYDQVMIDGTYLQGWCLLIAFNTQYVVAWQWCDTESKASYRQLLTGLPAPHVAIVDGGPGLRTALDERWPTTHVQRCFFHIYRSVIRYTTRRPHLDAGIEIYQLTKKLMTIDNLDDAATWLSEYASWESRWATFLKERTYLKKGLERPYHVGKNARWWYTHPKLRSVRALYRNLIKDNSIFTYLTTTTDSPISRTTSALEGGPNRDVKQLLRHHRGLSQDHARTAIDWLLNSRTEHPYTPWELAKIHLATPATTPPPERIGPAQYDTAIDYDPRYQDGSLHIRKRRAGK